jgi:ATP-dependent DNA helicase RecQ
MLSPESADVVPVPQTTVESSGARKLLREVFGHDDFREPQAAVIAHIIAQQDALVLMPTGGGKSLCYQLPALLMPGVTVVVSPLIALMNDQVTRLAALGIRAAALNSTQTWDEFLDVEQALKCGELDLLYMAPERLLSDRGLRLLKQSPVALFAIDEAHCVSQWGHDFRPEYLGLSMLPQHWPTVPRIALTATATEQTRQEILVRLDMPNARSFVTGFDRPNILYQVVEKGDVRAQLLQFIKKDHRDHSGIVYCASRQRTDNIARWLVDKGLKAMPYHAGLDRETRARNQQEFLQTPGAVMVATIAFGMGIDKPDVRFVAHVDMPKSLEHYYQETGRAGRDGQPANAWLTYGLTDVLQRQRLLVEGNDDVVNQQRLTDAFDAMVSFCEATDCRRQRLLTHFGQATGPCGHCDNCLYPEGVQQMTEAAQKMLSTVYRLWRQRGQRFGSAHLIDILRGRSTTRVKTLKHDSLSVFGIGADLSVVQWRQILRRLLAEQMLVLDDEGYGTMALTQASVAVLKGQQQLFIRLQN